MRAYRPSSRANVQCASAHETRSRFQAIESVLSSRAMMPVGVLAIACGVCGARGGTSLANGANGDGVQSMLASTPEFAAEVTNTLPASASRGVSGPVGRELDEIPVRIPHVHRTD